MKLQHKLLLASVVCFTCVMAVNPCRASPYTYNVSVGDSWAYSATTEGTTGYVVITITELGDQPQMTVTSADSELESLVENFGVPVLPVEGVEEAVNQAESDVEGYDLATEVHAGRTINVLVVNIDTEQQYINYVLDRATGILVELSIKIGEAVTFMELYSWDGSLPGEGGTTDDNGGTTSTQDGGGDVPGFPAGTLALALSIGAFLVARRRHER